MSDFVCIDYDFVNIGTLTINIVNSVIIKSSRYGGRDFMYKMACLNTESNPYNAYEEIKNHSEESWYVNRKEKLWFYSGCKMPRDLFRNSGYQIVRDSEKADHCVIPTLSENFPQYGFNVAATKTIDGQTYLYLLSFFKDESTRRSTTHEDKDDWQIIKEYLDYYNYTTYQDKILDSAQCVFLPKHPAYKDILYEEYPTRTYVEEHNIPIDYPTTISIDTLEIWRMADDDELVAKAICSSDWRKYPVTLLAFICNDKPTLSWAKNVGNFSDVLNTIGYNNRYSLASSLTERKIEPEDWNFLQNYIMYRLNLPENGGIADKYKVHAMKGYYDMFRQAYAVAPMRISEPIIYENLKSLM